MSTKGNAAPMQLIFSRKNKKVFLLRVEKNIPVPHQPPKPGKPTIRDLLRSMKVGDSVLFPLEMEDSAFPQALAVFGKGNYTTRKLSNGLRVWRVKQAKK